MLCIDTHTCAHAHNWKEKDANSSSFPFFRGRHSGEVMSPVMNFSGRSTKQGTEGTLRQHTVRKGASQLNSLQETCLPTDHGAGLEGDSPQPAWR